MLASSALAQGDNSEIHQIGDHNGASLAAEVHQLAPVHLSNVNRPSTNHTATVSQGIAPNP